MVQLSLDSNIDDQDAPRRLSVSEVLDQVKQCVEPAFEGIEVEGELSNFSQARSGHCYFTLKDASAQLQCVMWRSRARRLRFAPEDGMLVRARGDATVYATRGQLQLQVSSMHLAGEGALQKAFDELKRRLRDEGLFDATHKRPLPRFPDRIGVITSGEGAALQDILSTLCRRFPCVEVQLLSVPVQGVHAPRRIVQAIEHFNSNSAGPTPDVLIIGRGGGSLEDLWAFNDEPVARAVHMSAIPIISAVGHETDFAITDFVADVRAATPSIAAELAVPDCVELRSHVQALHERATELLRASIRDSRSRVQHLAQSRALHRPVDLLRRHQMRVDELNRRLDHSTRSCVREHRHRLARLRDQLLSLHPTAPLTRGYARVERHDGTPISRGGDLLAGEEVQIRFSDTTRRAKITGGKDAASST